MGKKIDDFIAAYTRLIIRLRWLVIPAVILLGMALGSGGRFLEFDTDYRVYFGPDNPQLQAWDQIEGTYTKNDNILFAIEPKGEQKSGKGFSRDTLIAVEKLTEAGWQLPYSIRVDSVTNFQRTDADGDDLLVRDLVIDPANRTPAELADALRYAQNDPLIANNLLNSDASMVAVNVTFHLPGESNAETPAVVKAARELRDRILAEHPDINIYMTGAMMINVSFTEAAQQDIVTLVPIMYGLIIIVMIVLLRSLWATFATLIVIGLSAAAGMGFAGFAGIVLTPPSASAPTIILTLAVADSVHILVTQFQAMRRGNDKIAALIETMRLNAMPVFLTSVTTALGFLTINFTDSPPLKDLGNISAFGIMAAWFFSVTLLPALIAVLPLKAPKEDGRMHGLMDRFGKFLVRRQNPVLLISLAVTAVMVALVPMNEANDQFHEYFDPSFQFRTDTDYILEHMTGFYPLHFNLDTGETNGITDPAYLKKLEEFEEFWKSIDGVNYVYNFANIMKRLNKNMHGDDPAWYRIPDNRELAAQYLLLYEFSLPFGLDLNNQINIEKSGTRFTAIFPNISSKETRYYAELGENWLRENAPEIFSYATSPPVMFSYISERNIKAMFIGMPIALVGISLLLIFALGSVKMGLLSLVPNLVPLGLAFGVWALFDGQIIFTMAVVLGMTLGIVVDDTIHFMSKYLRARREMGQNAEDAVRHAMRTVGSAILVTSMILTAGFLVLGLSPFAPNGTMAQLTAIAIVMAVLADFFLLPTLLMKLDKQTAVHTIDSSVAVQTS